MNKIINQNLYKSPDYAVHPPIENRFPDGRQFNFNQSGTLADLFSQFNQNRNPAYGQNYGTGLRPEQASARIQQLAAAGKQQAVTPYYGGNTVWNNTQQPNHSLNQLFDNSFNDFRNRQTNLMAKNPYRRGM